MPRVVDINGVDGAAGASAGAVAECWMIDSEWRRSAPPHMNAGSMESAPAGCRVRQQVVLLPPATYEDRAEHALDAVAGGAPRVVRLCPGRHGHNFVLADWVLRPLPEICESAGLSLAVDYVDPAGDTPWPELLIFARNYPALPIVLVGARFEQDRSTFAALDCAPNLVLEISQLAPSASLGLLVSRFGAHRFVFGSGGVPRAIDRWADADLLPEDRAAVFAGNADALDSATWQSMFL